jgi:hypothetical protein
MRQCREHAGIRQASNIEQRQCTVECKRCETNERLFRQEGEEKKESIDSQITFPSSTHCTFIATH